MSPTRTAARTARNPSVARAARRRRALVVLAVALVLALAPFTVVQAVGQRYVVPDPADVPARPVALVLGAGLTGAGTPSPYLARRLDAAVDLLDRGLVTTILVSGDRSGPDHDEPGAMLAYLVEHGVPPEAVVRDDEGFDTVSSCVRAHDLLGVDAAVVLTQDYHLRRALFSCRTAGIDAVGVGVSAQSARPWQAVLWHARELPASTKAAWDALRR